MSSIGSPAQRLSGNWKGEDQREGRRRMCELGSMLVSCCSGPAASRHGTSLPAASVPKNTARGNSSEKLRRWQKQGLPHAGIGCGIPPSGPLGRPTAIPGSPFGRWYPKWCEAEGSAAFPLQRLGSAPSHLHLGPGRPLAALSPWGSKSPVGAVPWKVPRPPHGPAGRGGQQRERDRCRGGCASRSPPPQNGDAAPPRLPAGTNPPHSLLRWSWTDRTSPPGSRLLPLPCRGCPQVRPAPAAGGACPAGSVGSDPARNAAAAPRERRGGTAPAPESAAARRRRWHLPPSPARLGPGPTPAPGGRQPPNGARERRRGRGGSCPALGRMATGWDRRRGLGEGGEGTRSEALPEPSAGQPPSLGSPGSQELWHGWECRAARLRDSGSDEPAGLAGSSPSLLDSPVCKVCVPCDLLGRERGEIQQRVLWETCVRWCLVGR